MLAEKICFPNKQYTPCVVNESTYSRKFNAPTSTSAVQQFQVYYFPAIVAIVAIAGAAQ
jgi:hypothetical protein